MALLPCHALFQFYVADGRPVVPAVPAQCRRAARRAVQHRLLCAAHAHGRAAVRSRAGRLRLDRRRLPPVPESSRAGRAAAVARRCRCRACTSGAGRGRCSNTRSTISRSSTTAPMQPSKLPSPFRISIRSEPSTLSKPMIEVRHSPIHGYGVFALRRIRQGHAADRIPRRAGQPTRRPTAATRTKIPRTTTPSCSRSTRARSLTAASAATRRDTSIMAATELRKHDLEQARVHRSHPHGAAGRRIELRLPDPARSRGRAERRRDFRLPLRGGEMSRQHAGGAEEEAQGRGGRSAAKKRAVAKKRAAAKKRSAAKKRPVAKKSAAATGRRARVSGAIDSPSAALARELCDHGVAVRDEYVDAGAWRELSDCAAERHARGEFHEARIGAGGGLRRDAAIRGDSTCWLQEPLFAANRRFSSGSNSCASPSIANACLACSTLRCTMRAILRSGLRAPPR